MQETFSHNINSVRERIEAAALRAGRDPSEITLIAVSKLHPVEAVDAAAKCGITDFAENKVQELCAKRPLVKADVRWHLIGHLQTNKVKQVIDKVCMIHSVDSLHLAEEIDKRAAQAGIVMDILLQVNAAGEESKFGLGTDEARQLAKDVLKLKNVKIRGLMEIAPYAEDPEDVRIWFRQVRQLFEELKSTDLPWLDTLSMGMSHDFETAIEEGATCVRVGTAIFGERDYTK